MSLKSKLYAGGIAFLDKLIIAFALILVALDSFDEGISALWIVIITCGLYIAVMAFVNLATMGVVTNDGFTRLCVGFLVAGFVFWLYPLLLEFAFMLMGLELSIDVKTVLLYTLVIRSFVRFYLQRRWSDVLQ